jgi:hypothetical protein
VSTRAIFLVGATVLGAFAALLLRGGETGTPASVGPPAEAPVTTTSSAPARPSASPRAKRRILRPPTASMRARDADGGVKGDAIASSDPKDKEYDPVVVALTMNAHPSELFDKEPRVPVFADRREADLRARVMERLKKRLPFDVSVDTECRTSSCKLSVQPKHDGDDLDLALQALGLNGLAETAQIWQSRDDAGAKLNVVILYSEELRDDDEYARRLKQHEAHDADPPPAP